MTRLSLSRSVVSLTLAAFLALPAGSHAQSWSGWGSNSNWSNPDNWESGNVPANDGTATAVFATDGSANFSPVVDEPWSLDGLQISSGYSLTGSALTIGGGGLTAAPENSAITIGNDLELTFVQSWLVTPGTLQVNGVIAGSGLLRKTGLGSLVLTNANTFDGGLRIEGGIVRVGSDVALGSAANVVTVAGGTLAFDADVVTDRSMVFETYGYLDVGTSSVVLSGQVTSSNRGDLLTAGTGMLELSGADANTDLGLYMSGTGTVVLAKENVYAVTTVRYIPSTSTLKLAGTGGDQIDDAGWIENLDGTLDLNGRSETIGGIAGTSGTITNTGEAAATLTVGANGMNGSFYGTIKDDAAVIGLTKIGDGTLTLGGVSTYSGSTIFRGGTVQVASQSALSVASSLYVTNGARLELGSGYFVVKDLDSWDAALASFGDGTVAMDGSELEITGSATNNWYGAITGTGLVVKNGGNVMHWFGANTFDGTIRIEDGELWAEELNTLSPNATVSIGSGGSLVINDSQFVAGIEGTGNILFDNGAAVLTVNLTDAAEFDGAIFGSGSLLKTGDGELLLSGPNVHSGRTQISGGTLLAGRENTLSSDSSVFVTNGATLNLGGYDQTVKDLDSYDFDTGLYSVGHVELGGATLTSLTSTSNFWHGHIEGEGAFVKKGGATATWLSWNDFEGALVIEEGALIANAVDALSADATLEVKTGARLVLTEFSQTVKTLRGAGNIDLGLAHLTVRQEESDRFDGEISGEGGVAKEGTATLELSSANSYTGGTTISDGTLLVTNLTGSATGSGGVLIESGGRLAGTGIISGEVAVLGTIAPGASPGTLSTGAEIWDEGGSYEFEINSAAGTAGANWDLLNVNGAISLNATPENPFVIFIVSLTAGNVPGFTPDFVLGQTYAFTIATATAPISDFSADKFLLDTSAFFNDTINQGHFAVVQGLDGMSINLTYTAVPEPAEWGLMLGFALFVLTLSRRRRKLSRSSQTGM